MIPISWIPRKFVKIMAIKAPAVVSAPVKIPWPVKTMAFRNDRSFVFAMAQFLFVAGNEMDAEINRQADEHGHEGNRQNIQMTDRKRSEGQRIAQADDETKSRFDWPPGFVVTVNKNDAAQKQG